MSRALSANGADDGAAVQPGQHQVENDERAAVALDRIERGPRPCG